MTALLNRVLALAVVAGAVGVGLAVAGVTSPARTILVLVFLAVAPTAAIARLLRMHDPFGRLVIAAAANVALLALISLLMLAWGIWSPVGGLIVVAAITAACFVADSEAVRARYGWTHRLQAHRRLRDLRLPADVTEEPVRQAVTGDSTTGPEPSRAPLPASVEEFGRGRGHFGHRSGLGQDGLAASAGPAAPRMWFLRDADPREVGGYRLLGRLSEGDQGAVFLAVSSEETRVTVKLLPLVTDARVRSRFLKKVAAAQQVDGCCTAQVLDAGIVERRPYIVSEYVRGPSLVEVIQQDGPRSGVMLERIAVATLTALDAMHAVGMVHRDFRPGNVLLGPDGPVVVDFGLAAVPGMTTTGLSEQVAEGTPAFQAPEQLSGARVTAAADMWAWAVTIAFAGTGQLPLGDESPTAAANAVVLHAEPVVGPLPEPLGSIVSHCLSKNPASRPSAHAALSQLVAAGARPEGPLPPEVPAAPIDEEACSAPPAPATVPQPRHTSESGQTGG